MFKDRYEEDKKAEARNKFYQPNKTNTEILKILKKTDTKYAKHILHKNDIVESFLTYMGFGSDVLSQPVCSKCERPGLWGMDKDLRAECHCLACGKITKNPVTVSQYMMDQMRKNIPEEFLEFIANAALKQNEENKKEESKNEQKIHIAK